MRRQPAWGSGAYFLPDLVLDPGSQGARLEALELILAREHAGDRLLEQRHPGTAPARRDVFEELLPHRVGASRKAPAQECEREVLQGARSGGKGTSGSLQRRDTLGSRTMRRVDSKKQTQKKASPNLEVRVGVKVPEAMQSHGSLWFRRGEGRSRSRSHCTSYLE